MVYTTRCLVFDLLSSVSLIEALFSKPEALPLPLICAGLSATEVYLNLTGFVGVLTDVSLIAVAVLSQMVSLAKAGVTTGVGSTQISTVASAPVHFSFPRLSTV